MEKDLKPDEELLRKISAYIGTCIGGVAEEEVFDVIENIDTKGYLVHGIKDETDYGDVKEHGILPLTPEGVHIGGGGSGSFWTSGVRVFHEGKENFTGMSTYDTSFFHWAHARNTPPETSIMNLALTSIDRLRRAGVYIPPSEQKSGYLSISAPIPASDLALLKVIVHTGSAKLSPREIDKLEKEQCLSS